MSDVYATDFKLFIYDLPTLPTGQLGNSVIHCSDENELRNALMKYRSSKKIVACASNKLIGLDALSLKYPIDTLFVLTNDEGNDLRDWSIGIISNDTIEVPTERQLMRRLCTMVVLCYHNQSIEYREKKNEGMGNLCILDSLKALDYSTHFV